MENLKLQEQEANCIDERLEEMIPVMEEHIFRYRYPGKHLEKPVLCGSGLFDRI
jgi:hypothetical protein